MNLVRTSAYAAITAGCVAIGVSVVAIANRAPQTTTIQLQESSTTPVIAESIAPESAAQSDEAPVRAGLRAYQDADGNFVAPPPGVAAASASSVQRVSGPVQERAGTSAAGGFVADASGFRMSQKAHVTPDGEIAVSCDQEIVSPQSEDNHAEEH